MIVFVWSVVCLLLSADMVIFFFFFKQKTAYEIRLSLVGSEMCIRDRGNSIYDIANYSDSKKQEIDLVNANHELAMQGDSKVIDNLNMSGGRNTSVSYTHLTLPTNREV